MFFDVTDNARSMLAVAVEEAEMGLAEGGIPIGAALFRTDGTLLGRGHNQRVQLGDPSIHGETAAFKHAGRQRGYADTIMVTTLSPCWYCSGLIRQFGIGGLIVGDSSSYNWGTEWLKEAGVNVVELGDSYCKELLDSFIERCPEVWAEDIGK